MADLNNQIGQGAAAQPKKKAFRQMKCSVCGHEWRSYGYGNYIRCPECYKRNHDGARCGPSDEKLAEVRSKRKYLQKTDVSQPPKINDFAPNDFTNNNQPPPDRPSIWERFLNAKIGGRA